MVDILQKGGVLMYPILLCSVVAVAVIVERLLLLRRASVGTGTFEREVREALSRGDYREAVHQCEKSTSPLSGIILAGLTRVSKGEAAVRHAIEQAGEAETARLERHTPILATIVGGAPLLGFLGTVLGMIEAFQQIEALGGHVDASVLAGGIWQALLTTAAGLSVGVVAFFAHNFIVGRIRGIVLSMEDSSERVVELIAEHDDAEVPREGAMR